MKLQRKEETESLHSCGIALCRGCFNSGYNEAIDVIQHLLDCEADCIKSGNSLSPKEQKVALDVIANLQQRMYGHNICDTAPYPKCNGANGCDTCEHQEEE